MCRTGAPAKQEAKIVGPSVYSEVIHWVCVLSHCQFFCRVRTGSQSRIRWRHLDAGKSFRQIGKRQGWWAGGICSALRKRCHLNSRSVRSQGPDAYVRQNPVSRRCIHVPNRDAMVGEWTSVAQRDRLDCRCQPYPKCVTWRVTARIVQETNDRLFF